MKCRKMQSILLLAMLLLEVACSQHPAGTPEDKSSSPVSKDTVATTRESQSNLSLDVIFNGPFAIVEQKDGLLVLLPDVEDHNKPVAVTSGDFGNIKTLERGDYEFTQGVRSSSQTKTLTPVKDTSILPASAAKDHLPLELQEPRYLSVKMPLPRDIAGWNADPMEISDTPKTCGPSNASGQKFATMIILRYDAQKTDVPQMTGPNFNWRPIAAPLQVTDRLVVISTEPAHYEDQHVHACSAFKHQTHMLGWKRYIAFPALPITYKRNVDLFTGVLPDELVQVLNQNDNELYKLYKESKDKQMAPRRAIFGTHNNCKSAAIWVALN